MDYKLRATDTLNQHATHTVEQWRASAGADYPAWIDADDSGLVCHDCGTVFVDAVSSDRYGDTAAQLAEVRANRAASFFDQARASRVALAGKAPIVLAPLWRNGTIVAELPARIVGVLSRAQDAYFIEYLHEPGETYAAFGYRMRLV